jgi:hypothetical protein
MPKQSRGFWFCSNCEEVFDQYSEAEYHERHECTAVKPPHHPPTMVSTSAVDPIQPAWYYQQQQAAAVAPFIPTDPTYHRRYYKPYPESSVDVYGRGMVPLSEPDTEVPPSRMMMTMPYESKMIQQQQQQSHPQHEEQTRYFPIMGSQERSSLNETDTLACRSLELFEVVAPDIFDPDETSTATTTEAATTTTSIQQHRRRQRQAPALQVGIRCAFCAESETTTDSYIFPANTRSIGDSIRHAGFDHLIRCTYYPDDYKRQIQDAVWKRNDRAASGQSEDASEEQERRNLIEYCISRCDQMGIIDRHPIGMMFANSNVDTGGAMSRPTTATPQHSPGAQAALSIKVEETGMLSQQPQYNERAYGGRPRSVQQSQRKVKRETREDDTSTTDPNPLQLQQHQPIHYPQHLQSTTHMQGILPPPQSLMPMIPQQPPHMMMSHEFPFFYEHNRWVCKYCAHLPPTYRDPQYFFVESVHIPPPPHLMDYHLSICREFQRSMMYEHSMQSAIYGRQGDPNRPVQQQMMSSPPLYGPPQPLPGWDQEQQPRSIQPTPPRSTATGEYRTSPEVFDSPYNTPSFHRQPAPRASIGGSQISSQQHRGVASTSSTATGMIRSPIHRGIQPPHHSAAEDIEMVRAIEYLESIDESYFTVEGGNILREDDRLVVEEDRLLLTDYFFYLMKQLRPVRFSEADRRTRGGKREKVKVGYGGLQCIHCIDVPNSRKFFWSNVDRLANSFAEIPTHVLKCRRCPQPTKDALLVLKNRHAEQMSRLSRGSQKVFFRRMWRRLHQDDPTDMNEGGGGTDEYASQVPYHMHQSGVSQTNLETMRPPPLDTQTTSAPGQSEGHSDISPSGTSGSEESAYFLQRSASEAAKALVDSSIQSGPPSPSSRVLLAIPEDREWLSDTDCFVRRQLEVFCATKQDVIAAMEDRKYPIKEGQVGIRCIHCAMTKNGVGARGPAVAYPFSISGLFESAREIERMHLGSRDNIGSRDNLMITCENLPLSAKEKLESLKGAASSLSSVLRKYFVLAAKALGLRDSVDGIQAGAEPIPIGTQAPLVFTDSTESIDEAPTSASEKVDTTESKRYSSSFKRKADDALLPQIEHTSQKQRRTVAVLKDDDDDDDDTGINQPSDRPSSMKKISTATSTNVAHGISILAAASDRREGTTSKTMSQTSDTDMEEKHVEV